MAKETRIVPFSYKPIDVLLRNLRKLGSKIFGFYKNTLSFNVGSIIPAYILDYLRSDLFHISSIDMEDEIQTGDKIILENDYKPEKDPIEEPKDNIITLGNIKQETKKNKHTKEESNKDVENGKEV